MKTRALTWLHSEAWTILIVTIVSLLIWTWAAGETRESTTLSQHVRFFVPDDSDEWVVSPDELTITATMEGSRRAIARAKNLIRSVSVELPAQSGDLRLNLLNQLAAHPEVVRSGVSIISIEPSSEIDLTLDRLIQRTASVRAVLPGVQTQGEVTVNPQVIAVRVPERMARSLPEDLVVEAYIAQSELERHTAGTPVTMPARLRLPGLAGGASSISFDPPRVDISFTIRSIQRTITLDNVRVQLAGPTEDHEEYVVTIPDPMLPNVRITAEHDLIRQIEEGRATVVALIHLSSREKEQRLTEKRIGGFIALVQGQPGWRQVDGQVGNATELPLVRVQVTDRTPDAPAEKPSS